LDRLDHVAVLTQLATQASHLEAQIALVDQCGGPNFLHNLTLAHDRSSSPQENDQKVERPAPELDGRPVPLEGPRADC
jgi:hypothetical protein